MPPRRLRSTSSSSGKQPMDMAHLRPEARDLALLPATGPALPSLGTVPLVKPPIPALMGQANSIGALSVPATWPDSVPVAGPTHAVAAPSGAGTPSVSVPGRPYLPSIGSPGRGLPAAAPPAIAAARAGAARRAVPD
ncbi:MAG: hypothetical protein B7Z72_13120 [Gemmatimonadetes bacterium 21-71-4]|nr:MAG: hypothetical protein B7Z72_13120 [Gemmatimonadetes bacterium 21-71-4]